MTMSEPVLRYAGPGPAPTLSHRVEDPPDTVRIDGVLLTEAEARRQMLATGWIEVTYPDIATVRDMVARAGSFQREADAAGYGRPQTSRAGVTFHPTGMRASLTVEVAVVAQREPRRRCEACGHRRVLYALTFTDALLGNPDHPWRCAPCWGLR
jgi:hypothetical protein